VRFDAIGLALVALARVLSAWPVSLPAGSIGRRRHSYEPGSLWKAEHQIKILHGGAGSAFDEIVEATDDD
jgi:hypothetical protein